MGCTGCSHAASDSCLAALDAVDRGQVVSGEGVGEPCALVEKVVGETAAVSQGIHTGPRVDSILVLFVCCQ